MGTGESDGKRWSVGRRVKVYEVLAERWAGGQESGTCQRRIEEQQGGNHT